MANEVRLVDLDVIKRYSLAVRQESAPAKELLDALDASRAFVQQVIEHSSEKAESPPTKRTRAPRRSKAAS